MALIARIEREARVSYRVFSTASELAELVEGDLAVLLAERFDTQRRRLAAAPQGTVTLLFTDIEGSTRLLSELGDVRYATVLAEHHALLREAFEQLGGFEVQTEGDAFFVTFASAASAVSAAVAAQRSFAAHEFVHGGRLRVRMGLHTGEARVDAESYVGFEVHRAARVAASGHGGQVVLSEQTRSLVALQGLPADVSVRELGVHRLKDIRIPSGSTTWRSRGCPRASRR